MQPAESANGKKEPRKLQALDILLEQAGLYSKFLAEQIHDIQYKTEGPAKQEGEVQPVRTEAAAAPSKPSKARHKPTSKAASKKRKTEEGPLPPAAPATALSPTQELLPLIRGGELRDYQLQGVKWLISLYQNGVNGILADEMGLGKTVQAIGFISYLRSQGVLGPIMVVAPLSTLPNWENEFHKWLPSVQTVLYHGSKEVRHKMQETVLQGALKNIGESPVIITSYEMVIADRRFLQRIWFKYLVVDEGHRLKNFNCKLLQELRHISADNKLLMTGTPLQNNLAELWSLLNFLMPEVFSSLKDFQAWFDFSALLEQPGASETIVAAELHDHIISKLHAILKPFVLRRVKSDVELSLPPKVEIVLYAAMTGLQKEVQQKLLDGALAAGEGTVAPSHTSYSKLHNLLMQLRKNCNHPDLITSEFDDDPNYPPPNVIVQQCGKMQLLDRLLTCLHPGGHKILVFSQMTRMLDLIESYLEQQGHRVCRIDGSVASEERQKNIQDFSSDPATWIFLLSTRAGGLGINLTAADTVIIYDSDWNPQQDMQAMDRCHRIGQAHPVLVFRLATAGSVEEKMLRRAAGKKALERLVMTKGAFKDVSEEAGYASLSVSELLELIRSDGTAHSISAKGTVSDATLHALLDRSYLTAHTPAPFAPQGIGYEVVTPGGSQAMLQGIT